LIVRKPILAAILGTIPLLGAVVALPAHAAAPTIETSLTDVVASPNVVDADHPNTTITGVARYKDAGGDLQPLAGKEVDLVGQYSLPNKPFVHMKATTATDGSFTFAYKATGTDSRYMTVRLPEQDQYKPATTANYPTELFKYQALPSRITVDSGIRRPPGGIGTITITGSGEVQGTDGKWGPASGIPVRIWLSCIGIPSPVAGCPSATIGRGTMQNGRFSIPITFKGEGKVAAADGRADVFMITDYVDVSMYEKIAQGYFYNPPWDAGIRYEPASGNFTLLPAGPATPTPSPSPSQPSPSPSHPSPSPSHSSSPQPSPSPSQPSPGQPAAKLTLNAPKRAAKGGTVALTGSACGSCQVKVYFQPEGKAAWKQVAAVNTKADGSYRTSVKATGDGRWQIKAQNAASPVRTVDVGLKTSMRAKVTPRKPHKGAKFTVSGTLSSFDGKWRRIAHGKVCLYRSTGARLACVKTDKHGVWHVTLKSRKDLTVVAGIAGTDTYLPTSSSVRVDVR
jgi:hypothetical protein